MCKEEIDATLEVMERLVKCVPENGKLCAKAAIHLTWGNRKGKVVACIEGASIVIRSTSFESNLWERETEVRTRSPKVAGGFITKFLEKLES